MPNLTTIKCPKCGESFELNEAFKHQLEVEMLAGERTKHQEELDRVKKEAEEEAKKRAEKDFALSSKKLESETKEEKERNIKLQDQILSLTEELRKTRRDKDDIKLEFAKKLAEDEEKIMKSTRAKVEEEHQLKDREKDKQIQDILKINQELRSKAEQGSQQAQGESLELELEELLKKEFPMDEIKEIAKGVRGADILQQVVDKYGRKCGSILWESKNANWQSNWIQKLKEDQRSAKAHMAVLVTVNLPEDINNSTFRDGVWITNRSFALTLAWAIRINIGQIFNLKLAGEGKNEKMEILFSYLTGTEFVHRVDAIIEGFTNLQKEIEKEKRWFETKWAREEKEIRKIVSNTHGMYGDLQGITGKSLPDIKTLELESGEAE